MIEKQPTENAVMFIDFANWLDDRAYDDFKHAVLSSDNEHEVERALARARRLQAIAILLGAKDLSFYKTLENDECAT